MRQKLEIKYVPYFPVHQRDLVHAEELPDSVTVNDQEVVNLSKMVKIFFLKRSILECQEFPLGSFHPQDGPLVVQKYLQECILVSRDSETLYALSERMKPLAT